MDSTGVALISSILGWGLRLGLLLLGDGMGLLLPELNALPFTEDPDVFASCADVVTRFELEQTCFGAVLTTQLSELPGNAHCTTLSVSGIETSETREDRLLLEEV